MESRKSLNAVLAVAVPLAMLLLVRTITATAADSGRGTACAAIDDPTARLACYDAAFPRPARAGATAPPSAADGVPAVVASPAPAPAGPSVVAPSAAAAAAPAVHAALPARPVSDEDKFGLSERQRAEREPKPEKPPANAVTADVVAVRKLPSGYLVIDLDNEQQWQQIESAPNLYLRTGERVTIRKASLGSFLLESDSNFSVRVRRVK